MGDHRPEPTLAPEAIAGITAALFFGAAVFSAVADLCGRWDAGLFVGYMLLCPALFLGGVAVGPSPRPRDDETYWD